MKKKRFHGSAYTVTWTIGCLIGLLLAIPVNAEAGERGLIGSGQGGPQKTVRPPMSPDAWVKAEGYVFDLDQVWGLRIKPRGVFQIPGGVGLLYNSRPPAGFDAPEGFASQQTGSLAFSRNLLDWHDYPGNPVLHEVQDWQGSQRAMPRAMLYDETNEQWVVYFGDSHGDYPGIRAGGTAFSKDLVTWHYAPGPTITIDDYVNAVPERIEASREELDAEGRIYPSWAIYHEGRYYLNVTGTNRTGENRSYGSILLVSDEPTGPFEYVEDFQGDFMPGTRPVYSDGTWYAVFSSSWDGQPGFGLAYADDLLGPYEMNPLNPIITVETTTRARPQLFRYDGTWAILFARFYEYRDMRLRLALANINPKLIPREQN